MSGNETGGSNPLGVIEGYQVFCNPDDQNASAGEGGKQSDSPAPTRRRSDSDDCEPQVHFQVKNEPMDQSYEEAVNSPGSDTSKTASPGQPTQISASLWTSGKGKKDTRKQDSNVSNVIEQLLRKNEFLLAQNDAGGFKPNPRKARNPNELVKKPDNILGSNGTTFLVSQTSQARVSKTGSQISKKNIGPGRILRPRSPTRKCSIPEKDKSLFNHAVMESKVNDKSSDKIFRVNTHEMVCAVACRAMFMTQGGSLVAHFDLQFYWCNFCPYHTTNKAQLLQHVMEHRFHCKYCRYQSFSRADVIHHTAESHPEFTEAASSLKYCTLLSDYLQIYSQDTEEDKKKRAGGSPDDEPPSKLSKLEERNLTGLYANIDLLDPKKVDAYRKLQKCYEYFEMDVETVQEGEQGDGTSDGQAVSGQSSYDVSKMITNVQSSGSAIQVLLDKSQTQTEHTAGVASPDTTGNATRFVPQNTFNQVQPRMTVFPRGPTTTALRSPAPAKPFENRPPPPPPPASKGRGSSMSSNLYWSCGYCNFTSHSQGEIKEHSQKTHRGRPHRYVALIRPPEKKLEDADTGNSSTVTSKDIEIDHADDNSTAENSAENSKKTGDAPTYKCFHCFYEVRKPGLLKGHMSYKHKGLSLVGLDLQCASPDKYMFFCPRDDCPFRAKNPTAYLNHVERCTPWQNKELNVLVEQNLLKCLDNTKQLAQKMMEQVRTSEEYSCIYCTFTGCYLENVSNHTTVLHADRSVIIKDLVRHRTRRKCFLYRCRFCEWESRDKEEWIQHCVGKHHIMMGELKDDLKICTHGSSGSGVKPEFKRTMGPKCKIRRRREEFRDPPVLLPVGMLDRRPNPAVATSDVFFTDADTSPPRLQELTQSPSTPKKMVSILPPVLQCCHCTFTCIGISNIKEHLVNQHPGNTLHFQDMQKHSQPTPGKFYLCPYDQCVFYHTTRNTVYEHKKNVHSDVTDTTDTMDNFTSPVTRIPVIRPKNKPTSRRSRLRTKRSHFQVRPAADVQSFTAAPMLKCRYCVFTSIEILLMKEHLSDVHAGEKLVYINLKRKKEKGRSIFQMCPVPLCDFTDTDSSRLAMHVEKEHDDGVEDKQDNGFDALLSDSDRHASALIINEPYCDLNGGNAGSSASNPDDQSTSIHTKTAQLSMKVEPQVDDQSFKEYCCLLCPTIAPTVAIMKGHYAKAHPGEEVVMRDLNAKRGKRPSRVYACRDGVCPQHFLSSQALLAHAHAHSGSPVFQCSECSWIHPELVKVTTHIDRHHDKEDVDITYITMQLEEDGITIRKRPATKTERL